MGHFALGFKALFRTWTDDAFASQVGRWLGNPPGHTEPAASAAPLPVLHPAAPLPRQPRTPHVSSSPLPRPAEPGTPAVPPGTRNEALSLLSVLQRDARFLDFVTKSIADFTDAQVAAAARPLHKEAAAVIERIFGVVPLSQVSGGTPVEVPVGYDPTQYRLVGNVPDGDGPLHGTLLHPGWRAVRADVPAWSGKADVANVVAPLEVYF